ncbi:hypothetical protein B0H16DRAFT_1597494, partial [Mycena metata]
SSMIPPSSFCGMTLGELRCPSRRFLALRPHTDAPGSPVTSNCMPTFKMPSLCSDFQVWLSDRSVWESHRQLDLNLDFFDLNFYLDFSDLKQQCVKVYASASNVRLNLTHPIICVPVLGDRTYGRLNPPAVLQCIPELNLVQVPMGSTQLPDTLTVHPPVPQLIY